MPSFAHGDVDLYYEIRGRGKPLLLVAGLAADNAYWLPAIDDFAARRQVILVDNRGSGRTTPMDVATSIGAMADDCAALIRHLQLPKVDVVGHSMGGMIAQDCAIRHGELFERVVLAATASVNSARNNDLSQAG
jgi:pimeloyl-ACP methyl ester carboxylesterase